MPDVREVAIGVHTDAVFGPVITFGNSGTAALIDSERTVLLPPLNHRLATDLISGSRAAASLLGKAIDTFCPMGPWLVSADSVDGLAAPIRCWVNGELRQDANTRDLLFGVLENPVV